MPGNDDHPDVGSLVVGEKVHYLGASPVRVGRFVFIGVDGAPGGTLKTWIIRRNLPAWSDTT